MSPWSSVVETRQADEAAEAIRRGFGYRVSLSAGDLSYRQHVIVGDAVAVSDLHLGARVRLDLDPTTEVMLVHLHRGTYVYNPWNRRQKVGADAFFLMPPGQSLSFDIDHADASTCSFSMATLAETAGSVYDLDEVEMSEGAALPLDAGKAFLWGQTVDAFRTRLLDGPTADVDDLAVREATRFLVVNAISSFGLVRVPSHRSDESAALRRALTFIDENLSSALTVDDIATAARLSPRGLLGVFQRERSQTPMQYVRAGRLAEARSELRAGDPLHGDTVAAIATKWGFSNGGRFSEHCRRAFGESPRETLQR